MIPLMIVEDEFIIRTGMKSMINWAQHGFVVVADAKDGEEALLLYETHKPFLIILDIKMEPMNGLEFMRRIREIDDRIHFIVISAHSEFGYAQEVIKQGADLYMNKADYCEEELIPVLKRIARDYYENRSMEQVVKQNSVIIKDFIQTIPKDREAIEAWLAKQSMDKKDLIIVSCKYDRSTGYNHNLQLLHSIINDQFRKESIEHLVFKYKRSLIVLTDYTIPTGVHSCLKHISTSTQNYSSSYCYFGVSETIDPSLNLHECFLNAYRACHSFLFNKKQTVFGPDVLDIVMYSESMLKDTCKEIDNHIRSNNKEKAQKLLHHLIINAGNYDNLEKALLVMLLYFENYNRSVIISQKLDSLMSMDDLSAIQKGITEWISNCISKTQNVKSDIAEEIKEYINSHLHEHLTMTEISQHFFYSKNYLGKIFTRKTGMHISEYINNSRISVACDLLNTTSLTISEISYQIGIENPGYFSQTFKKKTGVSPQQYRCLGKDADT